MKSLGEERLQIKTHLALRADQSSRMVNEFARAFLRKCSPPSESEAHAVGAKTGETFAPDGYAVSDKFRFLAAPHGSIYRDLFGPLLHAMIHCTAGIYFTRTLLIPAG